MKKWFVDYAETAYYKFEVEADSEQDALEKACDVINTDAEPCKTETVYFDVSEEEHDLDFYMEA